jgi:hypothetical protein
MRTWALHAASLPPATDHVPGKFGCQAPSPQIPYCMYVTLIQSFASALVLCPPCSCRLVWNLKVRFAVSRELPLLACWPWLSRVFSYHLTTGITAHGHRASVSGPFVSLNWCDPTSLSTPVHPDAMPSSVHCRKTWGYDS